MEDLKQHIENSNLLYAATRNFPNPVLQSELTDNDSDKTLTVPDNKIWEILSIYTCLVTTAVAGNRNLFLRITDNSNNDLCIINTALFQAASTTRFYQFSQHYPFQTAFQNTLYLFQPIPRCLLPAGFKIRIYDSATIDASADDLYIRLLTNEWDIS